MRADKGVLAWHFTGTDKLLRYGDGRLVVAGETLSVQGKPRLCERGMHGSVRLIDALGNAPGAYLWRVRVSGSIVEDKDKLVGIARKALWGFDATDLLREFARWCALLVIDKWDAPAVVKQYLTTGDESLRSAAWSAAWSAAESAAWAAARAAARAAQNGKLTRMVIAHHKSMVTA